MPQSGSELHCAGHCIKRLKTIHVPEGLQSKKIHTSSAIPTGTVPYTSSPHAEEGGRPAQRTLSWGWPLYAASVA